MTYTLKLYRQSSGAWSFFLANSVGGGSGMGNYRTKSGAIYSAMRMIPVQPEKTPIEVYHWTGSDYVRKGGAV